VYGFNDADDLDVDYEQHEYHRSRDVTDLHVDRDHYDHDDYYNHDDHDAPRAIVCRRSDAHHLR
jgi:hypothetical protein